MTQKTFEELAEDLRKELRIVFDVIARRLRLPALVAWINRKLTKRER